MSYLTGNERFRTEYIISGGYEWEFNTYLASPLISFRIRPYWAMFERQKGATSLLGLAVEGIIDVFFYLFKLKKAGYLFENKEFQHSEFPIDPCKNCIT